MLEQRRIIGLAPKEKKFGDKTIGEVLIEPFAGEVFTVQTAKVKEHFWSHEPKLDKDGQIQPKEGTIETFDIRAKDPEHAQQIAQESLTQIFGPSSKKVG